jgi:uncharacterized protein GlcG (DUF336 family)
MTSNVLRNGAIAAVFISASLGAVGAAAAAVPCPVSYNTLKQKLVQAANADTSGFNNSYWAVVVNRGGVVCAVAFSGGNRYSQWLLSRQIAAAKAFTANGLSLNGGPISSGQLYASVQPGAAPNPLFGLTEANPVAPGAAYAGSVTSFGTANDPMVGQRVGGTITFGGGLGLYHETAAIGGVGLSGDTACADHSTAWRLRALLGMAPSSGSDAIHLDDALDSFGDHPHCPNDGATQGTD